MTLKEEVEKRINDKMDQLQVMMESDLHLSAKSKVEDHVYDLLKYWSKLNESDREYIEFCQYAIENDLQWKIKD